MSSKKRATAPIDVDAEEAITPVTKKAKTEPKVDSKKRKEKVEDKKQPKLLSFFKNAAEKKKDELVSTPSKNEIDENDSGKENIVVNQISDDKKESEGKKEDNKMEVEEVIVEKDNKMDVENIVEEKTSTEVVEEKEEEFIVGKTEEEKATTAPEEINNNEASSTMEQPLNQGETTAKAEEEEEEDIVVESPAVLVPKATPGKSKVTPTSSSKKSNSRKPFRDEDLLDLLNLLEGNNKGVDVLTNEFVSNHDVSKAQVTKKIKEVASKEKTSKGQRWCVKEELLKKFEIAQLAFPLPKKETTAPTTSTTESDPNVALTAEAPFPTLTKSNSDVINLDESIGGDDVVAVPVSVPSPTTIVVNSIPVVNSTPVTRAPPLIDEAVVQNKLTENLIVIESIDAELVALINQSIGEFLKHFWALDLADVTKWPTDGNELLSILIEGSSLSLNDLVTEVIHRINAQKMEVDGKEEEEEEEGKNESDNVRGITSEIIRLQIKTIGKRENLITQKKAGDDEKSNSNNLIRWVVDTSLAPFPKIVNKDVKSIQSRRKEIAKYIRAIKKVIDSLERGKTEEIKKNIAALNAVEEKVKRDNEERLVKIQKDNLKKELKQKEALEKEEAKKREDEKKKEEKKATDSLKKCDSLKKKAPSVTPAKGSLNNFFKKATPGKDVDASPIGKLVMIEEKEKEYEDLDAIISSDLTKEDLLKEAMSHFQRPKKSNEKCNSLFTKTATTGNRLVNFKFTHFCENTRPSYWGSHGGKMRMLKAQCEENSEDKRQVLLKLARNPLLQLVKGLDYTVDSDDEWVEEEPGENLSQFDDEEDADAGDNLDYDDGFLEQDHVVQYQGDVQQDLDEGENVTRAKPKQLVHRRSMTITPHDISSHFYKEIVDIYSVILLQEGPLVIDHTEEAVIDAPEARMTPTKTKQNKTIREEDIPDLIKLIEGSSLSLEKLVDSISKCKEISKSKIKDAIKDMAEKKVTANGQCWCVNKTLLDKHNVAQIAFPLFVREEDIPELLKLVEGNSTSAGKIAEIFLKGPNRESATKSYVEKRIGDMASKKKTAKGQRWCVNEDLLKKHSIVQIAFPLPPAPKVVVAPTVPTTLVPDVLGTDMKGLEAEGTNEGMESAFLVAAQRAGILENEEVVDVEVVDEKKMTNEELMSTPIEDKKRQQLSPDATMATTSAVGINILMPKKKERKEIVAEKQENDEMKG